MSRVYKGRKWKAHIADLAQLRNWGRSQLFIAQVGWKRGTKILRFLGRDEYWIEIGPQGGINVYPKK